jgi:2-amino-4-hydroxy-6-hydroxymethyldihydropteridine diphosphokinase
VRYYVGLGANLGDRLAVFRDAATALSGFGTVSARSRVFATAPIGPPQPPFRNAALICHSDRSPREFLDRCLAIERRHGRDRANELRWGPRVLDLDLLLMGERGELVLDEPNLKVPHPRLHERAFVLAPLVDLDAMLVHPLSGQPLTRLLAAARAQGQEYEPTDDLF